MPNQLQSRQALLLEEDGMKGKVSSCNQSDLQLTLLWGPTFVLFVKVLTTEMSDLFLTLKKNRLMPVFCYLKTAFVTVSSFKFELPFDNEVPIQE